MEDVAPKATLAHLGYLPGFLDDAGSLAPPNNLATDMHSTVDGGRRRVLKPTASNCLVYPGDPPNRPCGRSLKLRDETILFTPLTPMWLSCSLIVCLKYAEWIGTKPAFRVCRGWKGFQENRRCRKTEAEAKVLMSENGPQHIDGGYCDSRSSISNTRTKTPAPGKRRQGGCKSRNVGLI